MPISETIDPLMIIKGIAAFGLVMAAWSVVVLLVAQKRARRESFMRQRLDPGGPQTESVRTLRLWHEGEEAVTLVAESGDKPRMVERMEALRREAGYTMPLRGLFTVVAVIMLVVAVAGFALTQRALPLVVGPIVVGTAFWYIMHAKATKRRQLFNRQFVDSLELCARALRSGHTLLAAFRLMSEEIPAPVGRLFADICQQQSMGIKLEEALRKASNISGSNDMKLFSASLTINMKSGGQVADVMEGIAFVIRERLKLGRRFRTLTAQTQFSKKVLIGLPFILFAVLNAISPEYMSELYASVAGQFMLGASLTSLLVGWFVMNKMADLKV